MYVCVRVSEITLIIYYAPIVGTRRTDVYDCNSERQRLLVSILDVYVAINLSRRLFTRRTNRVINIRVTFSGFYEPRARDGPAKRVRRPRFSKLICSPLPVCTNCRGPIVFVSPTETKRPLAAVREFHCFRPPYATIIHNRPNR